MMYEPSFTKIHSLKKEMQVYNFLENRILVILHVLKHLSIVRKHEEFFIGFFDK